MTEALVSDEFNLWYEQLLYAFDPERQAVLLLGGDKTGRDRFYEEHVPKADAIWHR